MNFNVGDAVVFESKGAAVSGVISNTSIWGYYSVGEYAFAQPDKTVFNDVTILSVTQRSSSRHV